MNVRGQRTSVFQPGEAASRPGVFYFEFGRRVGHGTVMVAICKLVGATVDKSGSAPHPYWRSGSHVEALGYGIGCRYFAEVPQDLARGPSLLDGSAHGQQPSATAGATLRELMDRMGHSTACAAMIYLHGSDARQREISDNLSKLTRQDLNRAATPIAADPRQRSSGTQRARRVIEQHEPQRPERDSNARPSA